MRIKEVFRRSTIVFILLVLVAARGFSGDRPNIIFLMTDDQRWDNFGCYGRPEFKTPNIDRLAEEGVIFDNAYYNVSLCMPSRTTMMTGRHFSSHRVGFVPPNNYTLSESDFADSYPALLKQAGYRTGFIGKMGFAVTDTAQRPSDPRNYDMEEHFRETFDFFAGDGTHYKGGFKMWPKDDLVLKKIYRKDRSGNERTLKTGEAMLRFLDTQPKDKPFCLSVSFYAVKHSATGSNIYPPSAKVFNEQEFSVPGNWVEGENEKLPIVIRENWRGSSLHITNTGTPELYQNEVHAFAAQGYTVDQQVGLMIEKLRETGLLDNTIIIYTSDNGRFHGSHGLYDKGLLYDEAMKEPLVVFDGRVAKSKRGRRENALISSVDIAPTIVSLAGLKPPVSMKGRDFSGVLDQTQEPEEWRDYVFMEHLFLVALHRSKVALDKTKKNYNPNEIDKINDELIDANKSYRCRGIRTDRWKYFVYYEQNPTIEELYDMQKDPLEQNDLSNNPEFAQILKKMRSRTEKLYQDVIK